MGKRLALAVVLLELSIGKIEKLPVRLLLELSMGIIVALPVIVL